MYLHTHAETQKHVKHHTSEHDGCMKEVHSTQQLIILSGYDIAIPSEAIDALHCSATKLLTSHIADLLLGGHSIS